MTDGIDAKDIIRIYPSSYNGIYEFTHPCWDCGNDTSVVSHNGDYYCADCDPGEPIGKIGWLKRFPRYLIDGIKDGYKQWKSDRATEEYVPKGDISDYQYRMVFVSSDGSGDKSGSDFANTKPMDDALRDAEVGDSIIGDGRPQ